MDISRITNTMMSDTLLNNLRRHSGKMEEYHYQLSSGKRFRYPSEDPIATTESMRLKTYIYQNEQYERNIDDATSWMQTTDDILGHLDEKLRRARILGLQGATETFNAEDRKKIALEVNEVLEEILYIANTQYNGRYLFSGTDTQTKPFEAKRDAQGKIINVTYQGDTNPIYREISEGVKVQINTIGDDLFTAIVQRIRMGYDGVQDASRPLANYLTGKDYTTGVFRINGKEIFYDITQDSLNNIAEKINRAGARVSAIITVGGGPAPDYLTLVAKDPCHRAAIWLEDLEGMGPDPLLQDLKLVNSNPPSNNIHPNAAIETNPQSLPLSENKPHYYFFSALINLREALNNNDHSEIEDGITEIDYSIANKLEHRARIGATINRFENIRNRLRDFRLNTQKLLSKAEDVDMTEVIMKLRMQEQAQQAALASGARLIHPTLMNFL